MASSTKYQRLLAFSICLALSAVAVLAMDSTNRWSTAWDAGAYRGRGAHYDTDGVLTTGTWSQAIISDCHNAIKERAIAIGGSATNDIPDALWWRAQRYDIIEFKEWIEDWCDEFIDTSFEIGGTYESALSGNSTNSYSSAPSGFYKPLSGPFYVTTNIWHTTNTLIDACSLPTNFFTYTPWTHLDVSSNGWLGVRLCMEKLTVLSHIEAVRLGSRVQRLDLPDGTTNAWYSYATDPTNATSWVDLTAVADAATVGETNVYDSAFGLGFEVYAEIPKDLTGGEVDDSYYATREIAWQRWGLELYQTNAYADVDLYIYPIRPASYHTDSRADISVYDDYGAGWSESNLSYYATYQFAGSGTNAIWDVGNTNGTLNTWCAEPLSNTNETARGWALHIQEPEAEDWASTFFTIDYGVTNGFKYK